MRFTEFGPSIPNILLDARDAGEVVFLCGAGISIPAGLPDFFRLTSDVATRLGCEPDDDAGRLIAMEKRRREVGWVGEAHEPISFDRIFTLLVRQFGVFQVEAEVAEALRVPRRPHLLHHRALLDLARGPDGRLRLITTNFDRLFHKADPELRSYAPPHFPDLSSRDGFDGVVHLHNFLPAKSGKATDGVLGLVLSSRDFGRAYLADAWATRFVRDLLDNYIVVLLGYSAEDPPIRYLLEGLHASGRIRDQRLYAFVASDSIPSDLDWRERGVTPITYNPKEHHRHLWDGIHAWAERARDVGAWRSRIVDLAQSAPEQLKPFERGQVAALCSSVEGARAFASKNPPPPAEWLCVFDAACRYAKPGRAFYSEQPSTEIDPLALYGLDDDQPRLDQQARDQRPPGVDILGPLMTDDPVAREAGIAGRQRWLGDPLNARLRPLAHWILSVMASPTAAWWAAGRGPLHRHLSSPMSFELDLDNVQFDPIVRQAWRLILEASESISDEIREGWHSVRRQIRKEGWTPCSIRAFAAATRPMLRVGRPWSYAPVPPAASEPITLARIGQFEVVYPKLIENIGDVPDASISAVLAAARVNLEHGAVLEDEVSKYHFHLPSLHSDEKRRGQSYIGGEEYFILFSKIFKKLVEVDAQAAAREYRHWNGLIRFFVPLKLFALGDARVTEPAEVAKVILAMSREKFWSAGHARELLWAMRARWANLSKQDRQAIERKILEGREKYSFESDEEYFERRSSLSAERLIWMKDQGLFLSAATVAKLPKLRDANPHWRDSWAETADAVSERRAGWVRQETDPTPIASLPIAKVIAVCEALAKREFQSFTDRDPFRGLVAANPRRAMAVLNHEARRHRYPLRYWSKLFSDWPGNATIQRITLLARAAAQLPAETIVDVRYELTFWFASHCGVLDRQERETAHHLFDRVVMALAGAGNDAMHSGIGKSSVAGVEIPSNRMDYKYAVNAPTGRLAEGLFAALSTRNVKDGRGLPADIRCRLETLLDLPAEGGWHPLAILARNLHRLFEVDRDWACRFLLPRFDPVRLEAEAAWSGFLGSGHVAPLACFKEMKAHFLAAFSATNSWTAEEIPRLGRYLLMALEEPKDGKAWITAVEARAALRCANAAVRLETLSFLRELAREEDGWKRVFVPFFRNIWPRDRQFQTADTTHGLVRLLLCLDEHFDAGVTLVDDFLVYCPNLDILLSELYDGREDGSVDLVRRFPQATLALLSKIVDEISPRPPYGLSEILVRLIDILPDLRHDRRWQKLHKIIQ